MKFNFLITLVIIVFEFTKIKAEIDNTFSKNIPLNINSLIKMYILIK